MLNLHLILHSVCSPPNREVFATPMLGTTRSLFFRVTCSVMWPDLIRKKKLIRMWPEWSHELEIWLLVKPRTCNWICAKECLRHSWAWDLSFHLLGSILNHMIPYCLTHLQSVWCQESGFSESKGSRAWDQFRLVWDPVRNEQVRGVACCSVCKSSLL